ncbi:hypothetical protein [Tenacibaculum halocynthiae]|uniref:hypothetical protein n=1 Tax=Tenacibaculum halocynthiae TaxID=1254437 RepID=UPI0038960FF7
MRYEEFDTVSPQTGLSGWFDGFCPSNKIADDLVRKSRGTWGQQAEWKRKMDALKIGPQQAEWESQKEEVRRLDRELKEERRNLEQEREISLALGLGAWCNGAVSRRKKAEESLSVAEKALGEIKGAFELLEKQQTEGIKEASVLIKENQQKLALIKQEIKTIKVKIEVYKAKRDNQQQNLATTTQEKSKAKKASIVGKVTENAPLIIGVIAVVGAIVYVKNNKKTKRTKAVVA